jgi:hypothetical protein
VAGDENEEGETEIAERGNKCIFINSTAGCNELGRITSTVFGGFSASRRLFPNYCPITLPDFPPIYWQIF